MVAPITSRIRGWPFETRLPDNERISGAVLVDQTRSIDIEARHVRFIMRASAEVLSEALAKLAAITA